jgi:hypothetical protein
MTRAAIVAPVRTAVARFGGTLRPVPAEDLAATVVRAVMDRSGVDPARIEDVVMAQSYANSEAPCIGRWTALHADHAAARAEAARRPVRAGDHVRRRRPGRRSRVRGAMTGPAGPVGVLLSYGAYLPRGRLDLAEIGATLGSGPGAGRGRRVVASFDEDSTTMGVEAARTALRALGPAVEVGSGQTGGTGAAAQPEEGI